MLDQRQIALRADGRGLNLRLHVANDEIRRADVVAQQMPDRIVAATLVVDLDGLELQAFGVGIDRVDDAAAAGRKRADVEVVRSRRRESDQLIIEEDRNAEGNVRSVGGAAVRIVVHDHVAGPQDLAARFQLLANAADVTGNRARLQWSAHAAFAQLQPVGIGQRRAEILGLADDARIAHPHQLVAHLDGNRVERALDDGGGDGVDPCSS